MWVFFLYVRESYDLPGTYIRACRRASYQISTTYRAVNTAKHSAVNPHKQQSKHAPIRARQCKQADRVGSSQHVVEYLYSSLCSQNKRRNRNLPRGLQKCTTIHKNGGLAGVMLEGFARTLLYLSVLSISSMHSASWLFSWTRELLAFASHQFAPKTMALSVRLIYSHFVQFFLVSERSGWRKPPTEHEAPSQGVYSDSDFGRFRLAVDVIFRGGGTFVYIRTSYIIFTYDPALQLTYRLIRSTSV